jgi:hypothetical protein
MKGAIDYFVNTVFNYPTLAECYKMQRWTVSTVSTPEYHL